MVLSISRLFHAPSFQNREKEHTVAKFADRLLKQALCSRVDSTLFSSSQSVCGSELNSHMWQPISMSRGDNSPSCYANSLCLPTSNPPSPCTDSHAYAPLPLTRLDKGHSWWGNRTLQKVRTTRAASTRQKGCLYISCIPKHIQYTYIHLG